MESTFSFLKDYNGRTKLKNDYKENALLLYALQLRFDIEDIDSVAADALTDGGNDKKCDLIYVDRDLGIAVVAQAYNRQNPKATDVAKENKACDLNTASSWVFMDDLSAIPTEIRNAVIDLQNAINEQEISAVFFWYVHNMDEHNSDAISADMLALQYQVQASVDSKYPDKELKIEALEVGLNTIQKWFDNSKKRISITDNFTLKCPFGFAINKENWRAFVTAVSGAWLRDLYKAKGTDLFSGNPRNFLGKGSRKNRINYGIIQSVENEPENFWAYNNGVTALVNDFEYNRRKLTIKGITIINGAQTTGAISAAKETDKEFLIPCRFIVCSDNTIIESIINNNNKQNEILPSDLRSNDKQQERLRQEFLSYPALYYNGGRRDDKNVRSRTVFDPYLVSQTVLAYHGDCITAYNGRKRIWDEDKLYTQVFDDQLSAKHIIFIYSLSRAIDKCKNELRDKGEGRTDSENQMHHFLSARGSKMLLIATVSNCLEDLIGEKIIIKKNLCFRDNSDFECLINKWCEVIKIILPFNSTLSEALKDGLKNKEVAYKQIEEVKNFITSLSSMYAEKLKDFKDSIVC